MSHPKKHNYSYIDEFRVIRTLGKGYHAKVKLAEKQGKFYAIKKYHTQSTIIESLNNEVEMMQKFDHPNIIKVYQSRKNAIYRKSNGQCSQCLVVILEYIESGQLYQYISICGNLTSSKARTYFITLLDTLEHMHSKGVAHLDIKPENILLDKQFNLKIADFGFATQTFGGMLDVRLGTEAYMAPQIRTRNYLGQEVDLYAAAIVLFIMYSGNQPFYRSLDADKYYKMFCKDNAKFWKVQSYKRMQGFYSPEFKDLINRMLASNPQERYTVEEVRNHPWVTGDSALMNEICLQFQQRKKRILQIRQKQAQTQSKNKEIMKQFQSNNLPIYC